MTLTLEEVEQLISAISALKSDNGRLRAELDEAAGLLRRVHSALDDALGDTDITHIESHDELRREAPAQWAAAQIAFFMIRMQEGNSNG